MEREQRDHFGNTDLHHQQRMLEWLLMSGNFDAVAQRIPGIKIVERREQRPFGEDCAMYLFGPGKDIAATILHIQHSYQPILMGEEKKGDFVFYLSEEEVMHVGKVIHRGRAISKFSFAHVYEHPLLLVPSFYGTHVQIWRKRNSGMVESDGRRS